VFHRASIDGIGSGGGVLIIVIIIIIIVIVIVIVCFGSYRNGGVLSDRIETRTNERKERLSVHSIHPCHHRFGDDLVLVWVWVWVLFSDGSKRNEIKWKRMEWDLVV